MEVLNRSWLVGSLSCPPYCAHGSHGSQSRLPLLPSYVCLANLSTLYRTHDGHNDVNLKLALFVTHTLLMNVSLEAML